MPCNFPSADLVRLRRQVATMADTSTDDAFVRKCCQFVLAVDQLRLEHEETGCACWRAAVKEGAQ